MMWLVTANFNHSMAIRKFAPECKMFESTNIYYKPRVLTYCIPVGHQHFLLES